MKTKIKGWANANTKIILPLENKIIEAIERQKEKPKLEIMSDIEFKKLLDNKDKVDE